MPKRSVEKKRTPLHTARCEDEIHVYTYTKDGNTRTVGKLTADEAHKLGRELIAWAFQIQGDVVADLKFAALEGR